MNYAVVVTVSVACVCQLRRLYRRQVCLFLCAGAQAAPSRGERGNGHTRHLVMKHACSHYRSATPLKPFLLDLVPIGRKHVVIFACLQRSPDVNRTPRTASHVLRLRGSSPVSASQRNS